MSKTYTFMLTVRVDSAEALQRAAFRNYTVDNGNTEMAFADAETFFGPENDPNIPSCLTQLLDPGSIPGCSIDCSDATEH